MSDAIRVSITPEQAKLWLGKYRADVQRPLRRAWVNTLAEAMKAGEFDQNSTIQLRELGDDIHLIDGRHRLNAIVQSNTTQSFIVITDRVESQVDLLLAFRRVNQGRVASNSDYFVAAGLDTETGLSRLQVNRVSGAVALIADEFAANSSRMLSLPDRVELIRLYGPAAEYYFEATVSVTKALKDQIRWAATVAVGLVTFHESAQSYGLDKVFDFWQGIARMANEYNGDPRGVAARYLLNTAAWRSNGKTAANQEMRPAVYTSRYLAGCFNAWVANKSITRISPSVDRPIVIKGSKFR